MDFGISTEEALSRKKIFGPNHLRKERKRCCFGLCYETEDDDYSKVQNTGQFTVLRNGGLFMLGEDELVPGDVVNLTAPDNVPADCIVFEATECKVNEGGVTGDCEPVEKNLESKEVALQSPNALWFGTSISWGECRVIVVRTGKYTLLASIAELC